MNTDNEPVCPPAVTMRGYVFGEEIGKGRFSRVFKCTNNMMPNKMLAVKRIHVNIVPNSWRESCLRLEYKVLKKVAHPHIVKFVDLIKTNRAVFIFTDYAINGSLYKKLISEKKPFSESRSKMWFSQILGALSYCHSKGIAHRHIKLDNLLLDSDFNALLSDFGYSCLTSDKSGDIMRDTSCGHPAYMAPECEPVTKIWPYDAKAADMYSMGVCLFEMLNFDRPFNEKLAFTNPLAYVLKQRNREYRFHSTIDKVLSEDIKDLVNQLLEPKPAKRITAENALMHVGLIPS